jgi:hypothetical protein
LSVIWLDEVAGCAGFRVIGCAVYSGPGEDNYPEHYGDKLEDCKLVGSDAFKKASCQVLHMGQPALPESLIASVGDGLVI